VPVRTSIGGPRFPITYGPLVYMKELAPFGLRELAEDAFAEAYRRRLDTIGVERLGRRFAEISEAHDDRGLALLCFEPSGAFCHRRVFARWWEEQTGQTVPELAAADEGVQKLL
jgi:hypothetical protein